MKKLASLGATTGFVIALLTGLAWLYIFDHGLGGTDGARLFAKAIRWLWPTAIMMLDADKVDGETALLFIASCITNGLVYASILCGVAFVRNKLHESVARIILNRSR